MHMGGSRSLRPTPTHTCRTELVSLIPLDRARVERERERNNASSAVAVDSATPLKSLFGYAAGNDKYIKEFMIDIIRDRN